MLRIERHTNGADTFRLIGRLNVENVDELISLFKVNSKDRQIILDLKDLTLVDREAVRILEHCETVHIKLTNCPAYIREWIQQERNTADRSET
jgi:ABC-type transporter Mla MlaB component